MYGMKKIVFQNSVYVFSKTFDQINNKRKRKKQIDHGNQQLTYYRGINGKWNRNICNQRGEKKRKKIKKKKTPALFRLLQWKGLTAGTVNLYDHFFWSRLSALRTEGCANINEALQSRCGFADRWWQQFNSIMTRTVFCSPLITISC